MTRRRLRADRLIPLGAVLMLLAAVALWLIFASPAWLWHPLGVCAGTPAQIVRCKSYNFHSGIEANIGELAVLVSILTGLIAAWRHHNCHTSGCPWIGRHQMAGGKYVICGRCLRAGDEHIPDTLTVEHIHGEHRRHTAQEKP